jgi:hypothetical protein
MPKCPDCNYIGEENRECCDFLCQQDEFEQFCSHSVYGISCPQGCMGKYLQDPFDYWVHLLSKCHTKDSKKVALMNKKAGITKFLCDTLAKKFEKHGDD